MCLGSGFGCAPPLLVGALGSVCVPACARLVPRDSWRGFVCLCGFGFCLLSRFFLAWVLKRVASCVRGVRFPSPSGGAALGVGWCGSCRGWGLSPLLPPLFFSGCRGVCVIRPCPVVTLWCPSLAVPVLGLVVSVPPSPLVWAAPSFFFFAFFFYPSLPERAVCWRVRGVLSSGGPLLSVGC